MIIVAGTFEGSMATASSSFAIVASIFIVLTSTGKLLGSMLKRVRFHINQQLELRKQLEVEEQNVHLIVPTSDLSILKTLRRCFCQQPRDYVRGHQLSFDRS